MSECRDTGSSSRTRDGYVAFRVRLCNMWDNDHRSSHCDASIAYESYMTPARSLCVETRARRHTWCLNFGIETRTTSVLNAPSVNQTLPCNVTAMHPFFGTTRGIGCRTESPYSVAERIYGSEVYKPVLLGWGDLSTLLHFAVSAPRHSDYFVPCYILWN